MFAGGRDARVQCCIDGCWSGHGCIGLQDRMYPTTSSLFATGSSHCAMKRAELALQPHWNDSPAQHNRRAGTRRHRTAAFASHSVAKLRCQTKWLSSLEWQARRRPTKASQTRRHAVGRTWHVFISPLLNVRMMLCARRSPQRVDSSLFGDSPRGCKLPDLPHFCSFGQARFLSLFRQVGTRA